MFLRYFKSHYVCWCEMCANVVFVISCVYSAVSLTLFREQRFIRMIYYYNYLLSSPPPSFTCFISYLFGLNQHLFKNKIKHNRAYKVDENINKPWGLIAYDPLIYIVFIRHLSLPCI